MSQLERVKKIYRYLRDDYRSFVQRNYRPRTYNMMAWAFVLMAFAGVYLDHGPWPELPTIALMAAVGYAMQAQIEKKIVTLERRLEELRKREAEG